MSWVKIDDQAREHVKLLRAGAEACWLWTCGLMYCNRQPKRDGFVPDEILPMLYPLRAPSKLAARLVEVGLWDRADGGYRVHDYNDYQPTTEQAAMLSLKRAAAGRTGGIKSGETRKQVPKQLASPPLQANEALASEATNPVPVPVPVPKEGDIRSARERATPHPPPIECPTIEHPNSIRGDEALDALARGSGGRFRASASAVQLVELAELARSARPRPLTLADFEALGRAYAAGRALRWIERPSLGVLLRNGGEHLFGGIDESRAAPAPHAGGPDPPGAVLARMRAREKIAIAEWEQRKAAGIVFQIPGRPPRKMGA